MTKLSLHTSTVLISPSHFSLVTPGLFLTLSHHWLPTFSHHCSPCICSCSLLPFDLFFSAVLSPSPSQTSFFVLQPLFFRFSLLCLLCLSLMFISISLSLNLSVSFSLPLFLSLTFPSFSLPSHTLSPLLSLPQCIANFEADSPPCPGSIQWRSESRTHFVYTFTVDEYCTVPCKHS